ncbi:MAG: hypothetical protein U1F87_00180 [Kiritimatiellia bacterium]
MNVFCVALAETPAVAIRFIWAVWMVLEAASALTVMSPCRLNCLAASTPVTVPAVNVTLRRWLSGPSAWLI